MKHYITLLFVIWSDGAFIKELIMSIMGGILWIPSNSLMKTCIRFCVPLLIHNQLYPNVGSVQYVRP